jgi:hypothetical protein
MPGEAIQALHKTCLDCRATSSLAMTIQFDGMALERLSNPEIFDMNSQLWNRRTPFHLAGMSHVRLSHPGSPFRRHA